MHTTSALRSNASMCSGHQLPIFLEGKNDIFFRSRCRHFSTRKPLLSKVCCELGAKFTTFAHRNSLKKIRKDGEVTGKTSPTSKISSIDLELEDRSPIGNGDSCDVRIVSFRNGSDAKSPVATPPRSAVLQACSVTSGLILALGAILRQASHIAFTKGWMNIDSSSEVSFGFEPWHLELTIGLVALISTCRYILLKTWPDFAESSDSANQQVMSELQPIDYVLVAFLPGISEELLFRGALLPLVGLNWGSALAIGAVFGGLHLGSGRKYSFTVWATIVGFAYGLATIASSSIVVPMAAHSLNNLVGGILWYYSSKSQRQPTE